MKKLAVALVLVALVSATAFSQSADIITQLLETNETTYGQAAYLAAVYKESVSETATEQDALQAMVDAGYIDASKSADSVIPLKDLAKLCARVTGIRGGLFYSLTHAPRYAYRELKAKGIVPQSSDPSQKVSGRDALAVLNGCIKLAGGNE